MGPPPNTGATNSSFFTALPGGLWFVNGTLSGMSLNAYFWSSSQTEAMSAWLRILYYENGAVGRYGYDKTNGYSARCLKN